MDILTLLLIACSLAMDAFAVSVSSGMMMCRARIGQTLRIAGSFAFFQFLMPLIGYGVARTFADKIEAVDHWVAFLLLSFIGAKMVYDAMHEGEDEPAADPCQFKNLIVMSIATSIDALAGGCFFCCHAAYWAAGPSGGLFDLYPYHRAGDAGDLCAGGGDRLPYR